MSPRDRTLFRDPDVRDVDVSPVMTNSHCVPSKLQIKKLVILVVITSRR